ncbi:MAG: hypothetical protein FD189_1487 [Elusimicrobia bacterium]|nr:MAG: hypothetical protein FD154_1375 [Elusimicrobiota bacterium]KAF0155253.1 MAG: hypothetical protein FD189_1487 [Elusimicrobiota bacterium]
MIRTISLFVFFLASAAPLRAAADPALCRDLRLKSAGAFWDSIVYELKKSPAVGKLAGGIAPAALDAALAAAAAETGLAQGDLFARTAAALPLDSLGPDARGEAEAAIAEARAYIAPADRPACEETLPPLPAEPPPDSKFYDGGTPETAGTDPGLVDWKDASGYAASRLGPLTVLLDALGPGDEIWLSNLGLPALLPRLDAAAGITALNLPISSYAKKLWLIEGKGGRKTLLLSDFQGRVYLRHFELLLKRYFSGRKGPSIKAAEARSAYERYYKALERLHQQAPAALNSLEGVIAGYGEAFRTYWAPYSLTSVSDSEGDWRMDVYKPAGAGRWGVITAHSSFYGETLGENIRYLVKKSTGIHTVIIAGSGGSLDPRGLYDMAYPSHVITPSGDAVPNELGSAADFRAHSSALSPLEETPDWIRRALDAGVSTVDVEMGPAAEILSGLGLKLGFAVLVTDFPLHRPVIDKVLARASLARQDSGAKYANIENYIGGLGDWLLRGIPPGWQPIEKRLGRTLAEQSALNLAAEERLIAPLSADEAGLLAKLEAYFSSHPPAFSVRMSRARAARLLEDEAFLSTELVSLLKGDEVKPFTPDYEQLSYGARRYIFGTLSYWDGPEKYGDTVVRVKERTWKRRTWATRRSAMRALAIVAEGAGVTTDQAAEDPDMAADAEELFNSWIIAPAQLPRALALQVVGELRALPPRASADFLGAAEKDLPGLIARHDVGWLEGRLWESVPVEEIALIKTPGAAPEISKKASALGIKVLRR